MSNEKVSQMTPLAASDVAPDDVFYIVDTSQKQSKKIDAADLLLYIESTGSFNAVNSQTAVSASHVPGSGVEGTVVSASYAFNSTTASYALVAVQVGLGTGSTVPVTSSFSQTASFLQWISLNRSNGTASYAISASSTVLSTSGSFLISLPGVNNGTASFALSCSQAASSSFSTVSNSTISASFANTSVTASFANVVASPLPAGTIITFAAFSVPAGWLECNGAAVSQSTYPNLFSAIGTLYGLGNDSGMTTFSLPDLRGYFVRGWDHGRGVDSGRVSGSQQLDQFQDHTHNGPDQYFTPVQRGFADTEVYVPTSHGDGQTNLLNTGLTNVSYRRGSETRPVNVAMMYLIKY